MLIKNGIIADPATHRSYKSDIRIEDGMIQLISPDIPAVPSEKVIDAQGLTVSPA